VRLAQPTDQVGRPSTVVRVRPLLLTLTGLAAARDFFTEWAADSYMRRSGWLVVYESGQIRWRLAFTMPTACCTAPTSGARGGRLRADFLNI
jgi:hypothetical protein